AKGRVVDRFSAEEVRRLGGGFGNSDSSSTIPMASSTRRFFEASLCLERGVNPAGKPVFSKEERPCMEPRFFTFRMERVSKSFGEAGGFWWEKSAPAQTVVDEVDLVVEPGEVVGLVGESGSGKTTLGKLICRLVQEDQGRLLMLGRDVTGETQGAWLQRFRARFQMLFQNPYATLNPRMTVTQLLEETIQLHRPLGTSLEKRHLLLESLRMVELEEKRDRYPTELSGGECRRVGLARTWLVRPSLVVADEPVAGLDPVVKTKILRLMLEMRDVWTTLFLISHDLHVIRAIAGRILVMFGGQIVEDFVCTQRPCHPYSMLLWETHRRFTLLSGVEPAQDSNAAVHVVQGLQHEAETHKVKEPLETYRTKNGPGMQERSEIAYGTRQEECLRVRGCAYVHRCAWAGVRVEKQRCLCERPQLRLLKTGHWVACHALAQYV
ncbi:MAG: ABC transporter ATP-binding protein, partial [Myxococcota bacterium]